MIIIPNTNTNPALNGVLSILYFVLPLRSTNPKFPCFCEGNKCFNIPEDICLNHTHNTFLRSEGCGQGRPYKCNRLYYVKKAAFFIDPILALGSCYN